MLKKLINTADRYSSYKQLVSVMCDVCRSGTGHRWHPSSLFTVYFEKGKEGYIALLPSWQVCNFIKQPTQTKNTTAEELLNRPCRSIYIHFWLSFDLAYKKTSDLTNAELPVVSPSLQNSTYAKHN